VSAYVFRRLQAEKDSDALGGSKHHVLEDIQNFLDVRSPDVAAKRASTSRSSVTVKSKKQKPEIVLPPPAKGTVYSRQEAADIMVPPPKEPGGPRVPIDSFRRVILHMIDKELVPVGKTQMYALKDQIIAGQPIRQKWDYRGRISIVSVAEVKNFVDERCGGGKSIGLSDVKAMLAEKRRTRKVEAGIAPGDTQPHLLTTQRYLGICAALPQGKVVGSTVDKSVNRQVAENSIMSAVSMALTAAVSCFVPVCQLVGETGAGKTQMHESIRMIMSANGGVSVVPVSPFLLTSQDDVTFVATSVPDRAEYSYRVASSTATGQKQAIYNPDGKTSFNSIVRLRTTWTCSAAGLAAAAWITIDGLTEEELPVETCPSGVFVLKVAGLGIDPLSETNGFVVFTRPQRGATIGDGDDEIPAESSLTQVFKQYKRLVKDPFLEKSRQIFHGHTPGIRVPKPSCLPACLLPTCLVVYFSRNVKTSTISTSEDDFFQ
jgi:hypothetical protein